MKTKKEEPSEDSISADVYNVCTIFGTLYVSILHAELYFSSMLAQIILLSPKQPLSSVTNSMDFACKKRLSEYFINIKNRENLSMSFFSLSE
jgi:hypothetical protein